MANQNNESALSSLVNQVDILILQHLNYLNKLEDACKKKEQFVHKQPTECNFGKLLYSEVMPSINVLPDRIREYVQQIEIEHKLFHSTAAKVNSLDPSKSEVDATSACKLILKLYQLEKMVKEESH